MKETSIEFNARANAAASAEELYEILKEEYPEITKEEAENAFAVSKSSVTVLDDDDLDGVSGGSHMKNGKTYSDDKDIYGEHRLIVFGYNRCDRFQRSGGLLKCCMNCGNAAKKGLTYYCTIRTEENGM